MSENMTTREAIAEIAQELRDEWVVCTTGYTCRDMQAVADRPENFYLIGAMGVAASVGLGLALRNRSAAVVVLDGDGSILMGLGALAMVGGLEPANLLHVVLDNEAFASTGGQGTYSSKVRLDALAASAGYRCVRRAQQPGEARSAFRALRAERGPSFLLLKCRQDAGEPMARVRIPPEEMTARFREASHAERKEK